MIKRIFKTASLLMAAAMLSVSCDPVENGSTGGGTETPDGSLSLDADKLIIQSNGEDAVTFTVKLGEEVVTDGVVFHDARNKDAVVDLPDGKFTATKEGEYEIWAEYRAKYTASVIITAVPTPVPENPEDPQPSSTSFAKKVLFAQFTDATCGNCPVMKLSIKKAWEKYPDLKSKIVKVDIHSMSSLQKDPAYISCGVANTWPFCYVDFSAGISAMSSVDYNVNVIKKAIDDRYSMPAKAQVAVNAKYADGVITLKTVVKAAQTGKYRIGAWLKEDGIQGTQDDYYNMHEPWMDIFDDSARILDSKVSNTNYTGHLLGIIEAGKTAEKMFIMNLKPEWKVENLELVVFVSAEENGFYTVTNVVEGPIDGEIKFAYAE